MISNSPYIRGRIGSNILSIFYFFSNEVCPILKCVLGGSIALHCRAVFVKDIACTVLRGLLNKIMPLDSNLRWLYNRCKFESSGIILFKSPLNT